MYQVTAPTPETRPSLYLLTNSGLTFAVFGILETSSGVHSSASIPFKTATCAIIETSAGATFACAACCNCTSQASPVGSATDSTVIPVSLVEAGETCLSQA